MLAPCLAYTDILCRLFHSRQYMQSRSFININWSKLSSAYENTFGSLPSTSSSLAPTEGRRVAPTITGAYRWIVDFLTANFQRESLVLGRTVGHGVHYLIYNYLQQNERPSSQDWVWDLGSGKEVKTRREQCQSKAYTLLPNRDSHAHTV